ncbi:hypothetical protein JA1_002447 [Spathaspora sp. JA1]|nr:hypothetical protein JA1_002447 [Spathaspora sp. JA1]
MASPILISKPLHSFSFWVVLQSVELTIKSSFKTLQNPELYTKSNLLLFFNSIIVSFVIYLIFNVPLYYVKYIVDHQVVLDHLQKSGGILNVFLLTLYNFLSSNSQILLGTSLKYKDMDYYTNFKRVSSIHHHQYLDETWFIKLQSLGKHSRQFKLFWKRYMTLYLLNTVIFILTIFPSRLSTSILGLISFITFLDKLGSFESAVLVCILQFCDYYYTGLILTTYYGVNNLAQDLIIPYFQEINFFSIPDQQQWIKTRQGILFGIALVYYWLLYQLPMLSMTLHLFGI